MCIRLNSRGTTQAEASKKGSYSSMSVIHNVLVLVILSTFAAIGSSAQERSVEICEVALRDLVVNLELAGDFNTLSPVKGLPGNSKNWSDCFVEPDGRYLFEEFVYHVFRNSDDVTVYILRQPRDGSTWKFFGPFYSAYRK